MGKIKNWKKIKETKTQTVWIPNPNHGKKYGIMLQKDGEYWHVLSLPNKKQVDTYHTNREIARANAMYYMNNLELLPDGSWSVKADFDGKISF